MPSLEKSGRWWSTEVDGYRTDIFATSRSQARYLRFLRIREFKPDVKLYEVKVYAIHRNQVDIDGGIHAVN